MAWHPSFSTSQSHFLILLLNASFIFLLSFSLFMTPTSDFLSHFKPMPLNAILASQSSLNIDSSASGCQGLHKYGDDAAKCAYVESRGGCESSGYISYLHLFYCDRNYQGVLGYTMLMIWLLVLFYLLGNTAAKFFCSSLEGMSRTLKLSPAVAGVTLLSLGNGAPDLFSSVVSFVQDGNDADQIGMNSILGGAFFVSSVVVGIISVCVHRDRVAVDESGLRRDIFFLLLSLSCLVVINFLGKINLWGALCFLSLYFVYVALVSSSHLCSTRDGATVTMTRCSRENEKQGWDGGLEAPLLCPVGDRDIEKFILVDQNGNGQFDDDDKAKTRRLMSPYSLGKCLLYMLELPLYLPRRLTIPVVSEEEWSKPFAVLSVTISPILLAFLSTSYFLKSLTIIVYTIGGSFGVLFGALAFLTTTSSQPPRKCLLPWLSSGFLMSLTWTYILARELISLLVTIGLIFGISPSALGLTILAWGNSLGDFVANVSMVVNGGPDGAQIAISGCYAGPLFNVLVGLGLSFVFSSWTVYPVQYILPRGKFVYETMGFLAGGLLFALVILSKKKMRLDRHLGGGLMTIYLCFLLSMTARASGLVR